MEHGLLSQCNPKSATTKTFELAAHTYFCEHWNRRMWLWVSVFQLDARTRTCENPSVRHPTPTEYQSTRVIVAAHASALLFRASQPVRAYIYRRR
jgi:hypothetical protein